MIRILNGDITGSQNLLKQYFGFTKNHIKVATTSQGFQEYILVTSHLFHVKEHLPNEVSKLKFLQIYEFQMFNF